LTLYYISFFFLQCYFT